MLLHVCWIVVTVAPLRLRTDNMLASILTPVGALSTPCHTIPGESVISSMEWTCPPSPVPYWFSIVGDAGASVLVQTLSEFCGGHRGARVQRCIAFSACTKVYTAQPAPYALHSSVLVSYSMRSEGHCGSEDIKFVPSQVGLQGCKGEQYIKARARGRVILGRI
jgi:hypothetical protein